MNDQTQKGPNEKYCSECGAIIRANAEICPKCGVRQSPPPFTINLGPVTPGGKNRFAASIFAILLGSLGIHKFYLGLSGWGIVYLLFCWTGIPAIAGVIEGVLLLVMSDEAFARKYG
ncbi:MAG: NINE protein [Chlorobiaceae bacterium]|nr:NINE protein [Chlorobiaceae bacterium]